MSNNTLSDTPNWYAIHTHPRQENRAESNLRAWEVETFAPRLKECRYSNGVLVQMVKPLFSQYIFARFSAQDMLHKVSFTRGVSSVVSFGSSPTPIGEEIIEVIRARIGEDGFVSLGEVLRAGDVVKIKGGPLKNFVGVFERKVSNENRVMLMLNTISYQSHLVIERRLVQKVVA
jgi:transcriptional antiterminator RfaH